MVRIRELTLTDIPQVAEVHRGAMKPGVPMTSALQAAYQTWLSAVFLDNPMRRPGIESLVADDDGDIIGFLGVVPRQLALNDRVYTGSVASNFCVRQGRRGDMGIKIAKEYLARSGDFALIDELTDRPRRLWEHIGMVPMPASVRWTLPLRPARHVLSLVAPRVPMVAVANLPAAGLDAILTRVPRSPFRFVDPDLTTEPIDGPALGRLLAEFGSRDHLRPVTSDGSAAWLFQRAASMSQHGALEAVAVRDTTGVIAGWYVYYARRGGMGEVLQIVAAPAAAHQVLTHLVLHARARGVISLTGTLDIAFLSPLSWHWAMIMPTPMETRWQMVYSRRSEVLEAFWRGRVLLSRLDGEWCHHMP